MKITRNGIEIELTNAEVEQAYRERRMYYNIEDVTTKLQNYLDEYEDESDDYEIWVGSNDTAKLGELRKRINDAEWIKDVAEQFDDDVWDNDNFMETFWLTMEEVIGDNLEGDAENE